ncbi:AAA family ATPase [Pseudomonadota bacterium]
MNRVTLNVSGYRDVSQIYVGGKSIVFCALRDVDDAPVILKIRTHLKGVSTREHQLFHEARMLQSVSSEYVPTFYELKDETDDLVLVYEDIGGEPLNELDLHHPRTSLHDRLTLAYQLTQALNEIHLAQLIHRDINPSNIIWNAATQRLQIIDFGLAMTQGQLEDQPLSEDDYQGTIAYIAPEQTGRVNRRIDQRSDLYSLGATLYELFTQKPPFLADSELELIHAHIARLPKEPIEIDTFVPQVVSNIVMKLMSKSASDRYQTAHGVGRDLALCIEDIEADGKCRVFPLAQFDTQLKLTFHGTIFGRDAELARIDEALKRVSSGPAEFVLIAGDSGVGKTALCDAFGVHARAGGATFVAGKFDQLKGDVPYSALILALTELVRQVLRSSTQQIALVREKILAGAGKNAQLLVDFIPLLEHVIGPQQQVAELHPNESQNRFNEVMRRFIETFAQPEHPLVVFLDDVQWVDPATLRLFKVLACDYGIQNLLVMGAFRNSEVGDSHLLSEGISYFKHNGATVNELALQPLESSNIANILAETLSVPASRVTDLADVVLKKTNGNAFFIKEFLTNICDKGLIRSDFHGVQWLWDIDRIEAMEITDNVADLLSHRLSALDEKTLDLLRVAACAGSTFDLEILAGVTGRQTAEIAHSLAAAKAELFINDVTETGGGAEGISKVDNRIFVFSHDRVQDAVYNLMTEEERELTHLTIGRAILSPDEKSMDDAYSYEVVDQLNRGRPHITERGENLTLAGLNLEAGINAKNAAAYKAANAYLDIARSIVADENLSPDDEFLYKLYNESAESAYLEGEFELSRSFVILASRHTDSLVEKASLSILLLIQHTLQGSYQDALNVGRSALASLDVVLPEAGDSQALKQEFDQAAQIDVVRNKDKLLELPPMEDKSKRVAMRILMNLFPPSYFVDQELNNWIAAKMVNLSMEYGYSPEAAKGFTNYGTVLALGGDYKSGYAMGNLALELIEAKRAPELRPRIMYAYLGDLSHWVKPLRSTKENIDDAFLSCLEYGELPYAGYILTFARCMNEIFLGDNLLHFFDKVCDAVEFTRKTKNTHAESIALAAHMAISNLLGQTEPSGSYNSGLSSETDFIRDSEARGDHVAICFLRILQAQNLYLYGNTDAARSAISAASHLLPYMATGMTLAMLNFYSSMICAALYETASDAEKERHLEKIVENQSVMKNWAKECPDNFQHLYYLVEGERARIQGEDIEAIGLFSRAIDSARANGYRQFRALGHELSARFWKNRNNAEYTRRHSNRAYRYYYQWGATVKLELLSREYAEFLTVEDDEDALNAKNTITVSTEGGSNIHEALDLEAISSASQSISREIKFESLLDKLAKTIIEVAGAEKYVFLLLDRETDTLYCRSVYDLKHQHALDDRDHPETITTMSLVHYVARTKETVLIDDARQDVRYQHDPYIQKQEPRSLLCMPVQYQGELLGIVYLENNTSAGVFTTRRLETLQILSTQAAISIHNAELFESLEHKVNERTRELDLLNRDLEGRVSTQVEEIEKLNKLKRFLTPQVSDLIVSEGKESLLKSHRKEIGIIFCDLRGFTAFSESVEPEEAMNMLMEYHEAIGMLITKYQATIDHRAGDGMMVFINDPIPSDDPVGESVRFSVELRAAVNALLDKWQKYGHSLGFGIGVSFGYSTIGMIGFEGSYDYAATGRHVNLASRLCDEAKHNQILITLRINAEIENSIATEFVDELDIKGFPTKVAAYNVQ